MSAATLTSKGQTTIPKDIRDGLGLAPGYQLDFHLLSNSSATIRVRRGALKDFVGILHKPGQRPLSFKAMDEGIAKVMRAKHGDKRAEKRK